MDRPPYGVIVLTTVGASFDAHSFARTLVERGLCACVNVLPGVESIYRWKNAIESDAEQLLVIKTIDSSLDALESAVRELHPYEVPEFVVIRMDEVRGAYQDWLFHGK